MRQFRRLESPLVEIPATLQGSRYHRSHLAFATLLRERTLWSITGLCSLVWLPHRISQSDLWSHLSWFYHLLAVGGLLNFYWTSVSSSVKQGWLYLPLLGGCEDSVTHTCMYVMSGIMCGIWELLNEFWSWFIHSTSKCLKGKFLILCYFLVPQDTASLKQASSKRIFM